MSQLLTVLLRRAVPGIWQLDTLASDAAQQFSNHGWVVFDLDLSGLSTKPEVLAALGVAGGFPEHYGHNWDAAYDCLTDLQPDVVLVRRAEGLEPSVSGSLVGIFDDAIEFWNRSGHQPYVLWNGPINQPSLPQHS